MAQELKQTKREKSPLYPAATIEECYEFIKTIDSLGGKVVSYSSILEAMGLTSQYTKSFLNRVGASKQFGLVTTGSSTAQLTDMAKKILYPIGNDSVVELLRECIDKPPLYAKLIERFNGKAIPQKAQLSNILMNEYRIIKNSKDNAAECFVNSVEHLGFIVNGVLCMESMEDDVTEWSVSAEAEKQQIALSNNNVLAKEKTEPPVGTYNFEIPTLSGKSAKIHIPEDVTEKDLDYIDLYVKNMLSVFIQNLKDELKKQ